MSEQDGIPDAVGRTLQLLREQPTSIDISHGYLDLVGPRHENSPGTIQALWASISGARLYDYAQAIGRKVLPFWDLPPAAIPAPGATVLDVGSGPGNVTAQLARRVGSDGLAIGLDIATSMLDRAVAAESAPNVAFVRGDATRLPFKDDAFDVATSLASLQLMPEPETVLRELARVVALSGTIALFIPTPAGGVLHKLTQLTGQDAGLRFFEPDEVASQLADAGFGRVHSSSRGTMLWITATGG